MILRAATILMMLGLLSVACVPGTSVEQGGEPIQVTGRINGSSDNARGDCVWIQQEDGGRLYLLLPSRFTVEYHPFALKDSGDRVVARNGDLVVVTGPGNGFGDTSCAPGEVPFFVEELSVVTR